MYLFFSILRSFVGFSKCLSFKQTSREENDKNNNNNKIIQNVFTPLEL